MITPDPRGYPGACGVLEQLKNSLRTVQPHWSYDEAQARRTKAEERRKAVREAVERSLGL